MSDFHHAIPHIKFKARFVFFKPRPIYTCSLLGFTPMLDRKAPGWKVMTDQNNFFSNLTFWSAIMFTDLPLSQKQCHFWNPWRKSFIKMYSFTTVGWILFKSCHFKCAKAYLLCHELPYTHKWLKSKPVSYKKYVVTSIN